MLLIIQNLCRFNLLQLQKVFPILLGIRIMKQYRSWRGKRKIPHGAIFHQLIKWSVAGNLDKEIREPLKTEYWIVKEMVVDKIIVNTKASYYWIYNMQIIQREWSFQTRNGINTLTRAHSYLMTKSSVSTLGFELWPSIF